MVFADDWGRHPSSCQHLIRQLLGRYEVYWVNTIGMRTPRFDLASLSRGFQKIHSWVCAGKGKEAAPEGLHVVNPRMWPWFRSSLDRRLNRWLLSRSLVRAIKDMPVLPMVVTTLPIVADLIGILPVRRWVYYCVDDFSQWPGLDPAPLEELEDRLIEEADVLFAVSETLREKLARKGRAAHLLTHGVDLAFWASPTGEPISIPPLDGLERPLVVFWGLVDRRMDVSFVKRLAADLERGTIVLVGPECNPDPVLFAIPRVVHLPPLPYEWLPLLAREAEVLIMPYANLPVTRAMQPLKLKEYLATNRPTVARDLPAVRPWSDCLDLAASPEIFSEKVRQRIVEGLPEHQRQARSRLAQESWGEKARVFERWAFAAEAAPDAVCCS
jgi:hypothetical protein